MRPVLTGGEYRRVDRAYQGDLSEAMGRAGHAVALAAARSGAGYGSRVAVLAGPGNNGGDGYVAARVLKSRGAQVVVHALAPPSTDLAGAAASRARSAGVPVVSLGPVVEADVVVDALFGGGMRRGIPDSILAWMDTAAPVIAVDYPTGLDPDTGQIAEKAFQAVGTVTFGALKTGHIRGEGPDVCGLVTVVDIGIVGGDPSMFVAEESDAPRPSRSRSSHKWSAGSVLVIGGSEGIVGASLLAGRAALNFGAGSVAVASPRIHEVQQDAPELPAYSLDQVAERLNRFDVVVAGPGLADSDAATVRPLLAQAGRIVLDAGGLTPASLQAALEGDGEVTVTPHDAEFVRVAGTGAGTYAVRAFAEREGIT
ncbi:MAG: NAD(P)H-hydrate epimerase, partial [Acidimicrobiia bacterium]